MRMNRSLAHQKQTGFSLLEVLVAIVVLSVGLLGLAALQLASLRYNQSAAERSIAVIQVHSIEAALRADKANALDGHFNLALGATPAEGDSFANVVLRNWREAITSQLGAGASGGVQCGGARCQVSIRWDDSRANQGSGQQLIVTEVYL